MYQTEGTQPLEEHQARGQGPYRQMTGSLPQEQLLQVEDGLGALQEHSSTRLWKEGEEASQQSLLI